MQRKIVIAVLVVFVLSLVAGVAAFAAPNMKEGNWEIKGEIKLEGMPFPMPPMPINYSTCLTKKDMVPQQKQKDQECTTISTKVQGDTVTWVTQCKDKKGVVTESTGEITYKGNSFNGSVKNVTKDTKGAQSLSTLKMAGNRTGDCK